MYRLLLIIIFIGGMAYLYDKRGEQAQKQQAAVAVAPPPPPPALAHEPPPVLTESEIGKIRLATMDGDPQVRWAAIDLLYRVRDPEAHAILQKALKIDSESTVRRKSLDILKRVDSPDRIDLLIGALKDTEKDIRLAALLALGEVGDPKATPAILAALRDTEPAVRRQALSTLGAIQTRRDLEHKQMQDKIRQEYERALEEHKRQTEGAAPKREMTDLLDKNKVE